MSKAIRHGSRGGRRYAVTAWSSYLRGLCGSLPKLSAVPPDAVSDPGFRAFASTGQRRRAPGRRAPRRLASHQVVRDTEPVSRMGARC